MLLAKLGKGDLSVFFPEGLRPSVIPFMLPSCEVSFHVHINNMQRSILVPRSCMNLCLSVYDFWLVEHYHD